jgi:hypothetical protein
VLRVPKVPILHKHRYPSLNNLANSNPSKAAELAEQLKKHLLQIGTKIEGPWTIGCLPVYGDQCKLDVEQPKRPSEQIQEYF